ncbi:facilitated trehalose transporter Tret1-like [Diabrotica virgifera virgifera]|uniref:Major facilitator superfamily (MFS) profile domain-containing protein n=1 Tax=Diabrotica virgifera virgifera TaxID=50390 RepID=A0ABM5IJ47_DIAVI|nr:facilitated trehalose transporter Tret1-like [Diabrotica virgifera virgifera]
MTKILVAGILAGCLLMIPAGISEASYGLYAQRLLKDDHTVKITLTLISIFRLFSKIGSISGSLVFSILAEIIGRKYTITAISIPYIISCITFQLTSTYMMGCVANFLTGFSIGGAYSILPIYIGEVATKSSRGRLISLLHTSFILGRFFVGAILGQFFIKNSLPVINFTTGVLAIFAAILSIAFVTETPYFYLKKVKHELVKISLQKVRRKNANYELELTEIQERKTFGIPDNGVGKGMFFKYKWLKPYLLLTCLYVLIWLSLFLTFSIPVRQTYYDANIDPEIKALVVGGVNLVSSLVILLLIDKLGRKLSLMYSFAAITGICLVFFVLKQSKAPLDVLFIIYPSISIAINIGVGPVPSVLLGEIFPLNQKMVCSGISNAVYFTLQAVMLALDELNLKYDSFPNIHVYVSFIVSTASVLIIKLFYIETKCKSLSEIERELNR